MRTGFSQAVAGKFTEAADGSVIEIPSGKYQLNMALWMDGKKNITIRGKGMYMTILSFKNQMEVLKASRSQIPRISRWLT